MRKSRSPSRRNSTYMKDFDQSAQLTNIEKKLSRTISEISNTNNNKQQQKINALEEKTRRLRATQKIPTETTDIYQTKINNLLQQKGNVVSTTNRMQKENINLLEIISFVEETMKTFSNYGEQLKIQLGVNLMQLI